MGLTVEAPSYATAAKSDATDITSLMKQAEIRQAASRENPFEEDEPVVMPPAVPSFSPPEEPEVPVREPDQEKLNSLLGDLTGEAPAAEKKDDLWS